ncbi:MAG: tyrosine-type recombinase/integrase [Dehalococcoidia bacterium]|nr:MAG: tyrosine-type recombinase/integrase [Dehalococcoidia bacterium]
MNRELELYRKYLNQKHRERMTVSTYLSEIKMFRDFIYASKSECQSWGEVTQEDAKNFCHKLSSTGKKQRTINRYITSLRLFYDYLIVRDEVQKNPFRQIDFYKISCKAPIFLNAKQVAKLVAAPMREYQILIETLDGPKPRKHGKLIYLRDQLILEMLYYSGMKLCELLNLCDLDIDREQMTVAISGKIGRNKSRISQLPECVIVTFTDYILNRNEKWPELTLEANPKVLRNRFGGLISSRSVRRKIAHYAQKSGLHPGISPATLRATFTLKALRNSADSATIQYLLGFEDMSSAESYTSRFKSLLTITSYKHRPKHARSTE